MGKSTISMAIFNSYVSLPEGILSVEKRTGSLGLPMEPYFTLEPLTTEILFRQT